MWSNGFYQTIDLACAERGGPVVRWFGRRVLVIRAHGSGRWSLKMAATGGCPEAWVDVRLTHGWIAAGGRLMGLRWVTADQKPWVCCLSCRNMGAVGWRRLLVRLRVPIMLSLA